MQLSRSVRSRPLLQSSDADHSRADMKSELKSWCQQQRAECLAQLAMFAPAHEILRADLSVMPTLEVVGEGGLTAEARQFVEAVLLALRVARSTEGTVFRVTYRPPAPCR